MGEEEGEKAEDQGACLTLACLACLFSDRDLFLRCGLTNQIQRPPQQDLRARNITHDVSFLRLIDFLES